MTLHDGGTVKLRKVGNDYDATNRDAAYAAIRDHQRKGEVMTGLLYLSPDSATCPAISTDSATDNRGGCAKREASDSPVIYGIV